ncbi:MAG: hypothetical protein WCD49_06410 [Candidatus Acidiferrales bacterium]
MKKLVIATIATYVVLMATNYLIHSVWLMPDYAAIASSHRTIEGIMHRFWAMALGQFFFAAMFSYIYTRGRESKPWLEQGIRYGIVMTFMTVVPYSLSDYVVYIVNYMLVIKWMIAGGIQLIILGLIVAAIFKDGGTARAT